MIAAVDVGYEDSIARAACVVFDDWGAERAVAEYVVTVAEVAEYEPGRFYLRELPPVLAVLGQVVEELELIVVDGYVWLDAARMRAGLGAHLYDALARETAVVGVAKNPFAGAGAAEVLRGESGRPLYVTSVGVTQLDAVAGVGAMAGEFRIPSLLGRVDQLARGLAVPNTPY